MPSDLNAGENEDFELTFGGEEATYFQRSQETKAAYEARIDEHNRSRRASHDKIQKNQLEILGEKI